MMGSRLLTRALVCVFCVGTPAQAAPKTKAGAPAAASTPATPASKPPVKASPALRKKASALFEEGFKLLDAGDFEACEKKFEEAYRTVPIPVVLLKVAECRKRAGSLAGAVETLERYLSERPDAPDRATVEGQIAELKRRPGTLSVTSTPAGAAIWVDGSSAERVTPAEVELSPGTHAIELKLRGHQREERRLQIDYGVRRELDVTLEKVAEQMEEAQKPAPEDASEEPGSGYRTTTAFWIFAGGAVAAGGFATAFGIMALNKQSEFDARPTRELYDDGRRDALIADVALGVAAASAITAGVLFFTSKGSDPAADTGLRILPTVGRGGGGVVGHVRF